MQIFVKSHSDVSFAYYNQKRCLCLQCLILAIHHQDSVGPPGSSYGVLPWSTVVCVCCEGACVHGDLRWSPGVGGFIMTVHIELAPVYCSALCV